MNVVPNYNVQIWVGLREGYTDIVHTIDEVNQICQEYVKYGDCVTVTHTQFIYTGGNEPGVIIGYIKYPRFVRTDIEIKNSAIELANIFLDKFKQNRITITTPDSSIMIENEIKD